MTRESLAKAVADWRVIIAAVAGLFIAGGSASMFLWGVPAKASTVAAQQVTITQQGNDIAELRGHLLEIKDTVKHQEQLELHMDGKLDAVNAKIDRVLVRSGRR